VVFVCPQAGRALHFCLDTKTKQKIQGCDPNAKIQKVPLKRNELTGRCRLPAQTAFLFLTLHFLNFLTHFDQGRIFIPFKGQDIFPFLKVLKGYFTYMHECLTFSNTCMNYNLFSYASSVRRFTKALLPTSALLMQMKLVFLIIGFLNAFASHG
jgi:hypothetical protein